MGPLSIVCFDFVLYPGYIFLAGKLAGVYHAFLRLLNTSKRPARDSVLQILCPAQKVSMESPLFRVSQEACLTVLGILAGQFIILCVWLYRLRLPCPSPQPHQHSQNLVNTPAHPQHASLDHDVNQPSVAVGAQAEVCPQSDDRHAFSRNSHRMQFCVEISPCIQL
jgi:hypothetical protein